MRMSHPALNISKANFVLLLFIFVIIWMIGFVELRIGDANWNQRHGKNCIWLVSIWYDNVHMELLGRRYMYFNILSAPA